MIFTELQQSLAKVTGKKAGWVDNAVMVALTGDTEINLEYIEDSDELYVFSNVASIPESRFGRFALPLMEANLFGKDTGGSAVLAYDRDEQQVIIWDRFILTHVTPDQFQERFSYLYLSTLHWANKIRRDWDCSDVLDRTVAFL